MFKKNATLVLFFLLLMTIAFFSASVFIYQKSLTRINDDLRDKRVEIIGLTANIDSLKNNVTKLAFTIETQNKREENLSKQFLGIREEKEELTNEKFTLQQVVNEKNQLIGENEQEIKSLNIDISDLIAELKNMNTTVDKMLDDIDDICDDAKSLNITKCGKY